MPFAVFQVAVTTGVPHGYQTAGWVITAVFTVGAVVLFAIVLGATLLSRVRLSGRQAPA